MADRTYAGSGPEQAAERTRQAAQRFRGEAVGRVEDFAQQASRGFDQGKHRVAERLRRFGSSLQSVSEHLPEEEAPVARYADRMRSEIERAAQYVDSTDLDTAVHDLEHFAQRRPALFFGSAFAFGLAVARFLKSRGTEHGTYEAEAPYPGEAGLGELPYGQTAGSSIPGSPTVAIPRSSGEDLPLSDDFGPGSRGGRP